MFFERLFSNLNVNITCRYKKECGYSEHGMKVMMFSNCFAWPKSTSFLSQIVFTRRGTPAHSKSSWHQRSRQWWLTFWHYYMKLLMWYMACWKRIAEERVIFQCWVNWLFECRNADNCTTHFLTWFKKIYYTIIVYYLSPPNCNLIPTGVRIFLCVHWRIPTVKQMNAWLIVVLSMYLLYECINLISEEMALPLLLRIRAYTVSPRWSQVMGHTVHASMVHLLRTTTMLSFLLTGGSRPSFLRNPQAVGTTPSLLHHL